MTQTIDNPATDERQDIGGTGSLRGRVALVTGGTRGIGASIAQALAERGATIGAGFSGNVERAEEFAADFANRYDGAGQPASGERGLGR